MILQYEHHSASYWNGYGYAVALLFVVVLQTLFHQAYQRLSILTAVKIKTAVAGLLYKKVCVCASQLQDQLQNVFKMLIVFSVSSFDVGLTFIQFFTAEIYNW